MKRLFIIVLALVLLIMVLSSCSSESKGIGETGISSDEFSELSTGMTKEKVDSIIGGEGDMISESEDEDDNYLYFKRLYRYNGEVSGYAELEFTHYVPKGLYRGGSKDFKELLTSKAKNDLQ